MLKSIAESIEELLSEAVFRVTWSGKVKYFRTGRAAHAYADRYDDAKVTSLDNLPAGAKLSSSEEDLRPLVQSFNVGPGLAEAARDFSTAAMIPLEEAIMRLARAFEEARHLTKAPDGKVYQVIWADGRGVQYFDNLEAAKEFQGQRDRDAREPRLIDKPTGARVKSKAPELKESNESLLESEVTVSGNHLHPHGPNGSHGHQGLPSGGGHRHDPVSFGGHRHRPGDPVDGQHMNLGGGAHDHLVAKGLEEYIAWSAEVHLKHPWIQGFKQSWIRHVRPGPEEKEFRLTTLEDWRNHTIWWMHSTGQANPEAHRLVFLDPENRLIVKEYEMENGSRREPTAEDFAAEERWFQENTPQNLRDRLKESGIIFVSRYGTGPGPEPIFVCGGECEGIGLVPVPPPSELAERYGHEAQIDPNPGDQEPWKTLWLEAEAKAPTDDGWHFVRCPECSGTGVHASESRLLELEKDVDVKAQSDADLGEDWRLLNAKYSTMIDGGKTEFASLDELERLGARIMREILSRGKMTFKPEGARPKTLELLRRLLGRVINTAVVLPMAQAQALRSGKVSMTLFGSAAPRLEDFQVLSADGKAFGFIRHEKGKRVEGEELEALEKETGISRETAEERFPDPRRIHAYKVREFVPLTRARDIEVPGDGDRIGRLKISESEEGLSESVAPERGEGVGPRRLSEARHHFVMSLFESEEDEKNPSVRFFIMTWRESERVRQMRFCPGYNLAFHEGVPVQLYDVPPGTKTDSKFIEVIDSGHIEIFADNPLVFSYRVFSESAPGFFSVRFSTENDGSAMLTAVLKPTPGKEKT